jgi:hypothetical protein
MLRIAVELHAALIAALAPWRTIGDTAPVLAAASLSTHDATRAAMLTGRGEVDATRLTVAAQTTALAHATQACVTTNASRSVRRHTAALTTALPTRALRLIPVLAADALPFDAAFPRLTLTPTGTASPRIVVQTETAIAGTATLLRATRLTSPSEGQALATSQEAVGLPLTNATASTTILEILEEIDAALVTAPLGRRTLHSTAEASAIHTGFTRLTGPAAESTVVEITTILLAPFAHRTRARKIDADRATTIIAFRAAHGAAELLLIQLGSEIRLLHAVPHHAVLGVRTVSVDRTALQIERELAQGATAQRHKCK